MLLMPLMRMTPGFWMPEGGKQTLLTEGSTGTVAIPRFARDDNRASLGMTTELR